MNGYFSLSIHNGDLSGQPCRFFGVNSPPEKWGVPLRVGGGFDQAVHVIGPYWTQKKIIIRAGFFHSDTSSSCSRFYPCKSLLRSLSSWLNSLAWFKGKSTGNHGCFIRYGGVSCVVFP